MFPILCRYNRLNLSQHLSSSTLFSRLSTSIISKGFSSPAPVQPPTKSSQHRTSTMDALFAKAMQETAALRKTSVVWKPDEPHPQSYYTFDKTTSSWTPKVPSAAAAEDAGQNTTRITSLALYTWNIDFMLPFAEARMRPALSHLDELTSSQPASTAVIIFLQECTPSDLDTIASTSWIRERFNVTDLNHISWATAHYGTTTLVDRRLPISSAFRVHYSKTRLDRDAFFVDVNINKKRVRLCNTHLESMALDPPFRPPQMKLIAGYLHESGLDGAITAGDFNAIQPFDRTLHVDGGNNLKDAFLELGGQEDSEESYTWGQQAATALRERFGCSRMDKVYFRGGVRVLKFERFGEDVLVEGDAEAKTILGLGFEKAWVTDHLGVRAEFEVVEQAARGQL
ncbi:Endonuclease/exonuclease/phosphatase [Aspergillus pseudoustus]|uniref:Endonuclease/exonuclease/phosphatase n=1 Tax=Aspergillus pseudoustus TaxID=1810923 RepID=A0ABR4JGM2_9EURO